MRTRLETIEAGRRQYQIYEERHPAGTIYHVPYRCYRRGRLGGLRTLKPEKPKIVRMENGVEWAGFATREEAGDAILRHARHTPYRGPK